MHFTNIIFLLILSSSTILAAPIPQGAGVGAGCDGAKRQGAGFGDACNAILTDGDTGSGLAVKEAGQNAASLIKSLGAKRQLDKAGAGTAALIDILSPEVGEYQEGLTNVIDGDGTSDSATIEQQIDAIEAQAGEGAGNLVPSKLPTGRRQLDKAGAGTAAIIDLVDPGLGAYQEGLTNVIDGDGTSDSATIGQQIGAIEAQAGRGAGNLVPSKLPTAPKIA